MCGLSKPWRPEMTKHHRANLALATFGLAFMALSAMSDDANAAVVYCTYIGYPERLCRTSWRSSRCSAGRRRRRDSASSDQPKRRGQSRRRSPLRVPATGGNSVRREPLPSKPLGSCVCRHLIAQEPGPPIGPRSWSNEATRRPRRVWIGGGMGPALSRANAGHARHRLSLSGIT